MERCRTRSKEPEETRVGKAFRLIETFQMDEETVRLEDFRALRLPGGFLLSEIVLDSRGMLDPMGRPALAKAEIHGATIRIQILAGLPTEEVSISIYHELLEALTVGVDQAPLQVVDFREGDFEKAARDGHARYGLATSTSVLIFLYANGFERSG